jgi:hypothetical protein
MLLTLSAVGMAGCADRPDVPAAASTSAHSYRADLGNAVALAVRRDTAETELLRQIGLVAERHGLRDWETHEDTYVAIGEGLRKAGAADDQAVAIAELVSSGDEARQRQVLEVYRARD